MRVPVRRLPETRVSEQQQGYARAVPGLDISPITDAIVGFQRQLQDEQIDRQRIEANQRLLREVNELQADFVARQRNPEISDIDFAATTNASYEARHQALLEEFRGQDFDREVLDDLDLRLGAVRQGLYERGLGHQVTTMRARAVDQAENLGRSASQYVAANPDGFESADQLLRESIMAMPDLTSAERQDEYERQLALVRNGGGQALAIQQPDFVISALDPLGLTAPNRGTAGGAGGTATTSTGADASRVMNYEARAAGFDVVPDTVQTLGQASDFALQVNRAGANSSAMGTYQITGDTLRDFAPRVFGANWQSTEFNQDSQDQLGEAIFNSSRGSAQALRSRWVSLSLEEAERVRQMPWSEARHIIAEGESGGSVQGPTVQLVDIPPSEVAYDEEGAPITADGVRLPQNPAEALTGNALLDSMNGPERMQVLGWAREQLNRVNVSRRAEMDVQIENFTAEMMQNGEAATPMPTEEAVLEAYGPVAGPQRWAQIQQTAAVGPAIQSFRTQSAEDIEAALAALEPTPGSQTYDTELQIYNAAVTARDQIMTQRQSDPAAYALQHFPAVREAAQQGTQQYHAARDRAYEQMGIDPDTAPLFTAAATESIIEHYKTMDPAQRLIFMRENFAGMGEDRFRRFTSNMEGTTAEEDARIYMLLRQYPRPNGEWSIVYRDILEGRETMRDDPARRPPQELLNRQFRAEALEAITRLGTHTSRSIQEGAAALYVQRGGNPQTINPTLYRESLAAMLGGSLPVRMSSLPDHTILPPRTNRTAFENWIERQTMESLSAMTVDRRPPRYGNMRAVPMQDIIDHGVFVMAAPGQYVIRMEGDGGFLKTSRGGNFVVNISTEDVNGPRR